MNGVKERTCCKESECASVLPRCLTAPFFNALCADDSV